MTSATPGSPISGSDQRATPAGRWSFLRQMWFPVFLIGGVVMAFILLGPASTTGRRDPLLAVAPPGGTASEPYAAPKGASETEQEIAKQFETIRQYPDTVPAYVGLGNAYMQNVRETGDPTDYNRAAAAFDEALSREPDNAAAVIGLGSLALARHEFGDALELGRRAVALAPKTARAHGILVDAQTELGLYDEAVSSTQTMVNLRPDLASYSRVSYQRELHGDVDGAIEAMDRAFRGATGANTENREYLRALIGDLNLLGGDARTAEQVQRASLRAAPGFVWALAGLARARAAQGDLDEAIVRYQEAVDVVPLPEFVVALGEAQEADGRIDEARATYELARAIQQLFEANGVNVDLDLALFEADHGDPGVALELAERAYADQPNVKAADALAWALHKNGRHDEARRHADEALRLGTPYGRFLYHAGLIARAQGDDTAAAEYLSEAIKVPGTFSPLDVARARDALRAIGG